MTYNSRAELFLCEVPPFPGEVLPHPGEVSPQPGKLLPREVPPAAPVNLADIFDRFSALKPSFCQLILPATHWMPYAGAGQGCAGAGQG